jgi:hypothetical protein
MTETKSNLVLHAEHELALLRKAETGRLTDAHERDLIQAVQAFADEGHSGMSAACATGMMDEGLLRTLLRFEPATPLTGEDDEWFIHDHDDHCYAQNKRCGRVFKERDGSAYDIDARVFRDPDGSCWTNSDSALPVTFPYVPKTEVVDRPADHA